MINLDDRLLSKLTPNELFLLLQIVKRMRINKMVSWPSVEKLQDECNWDERTVKKWRSSLIKKGYIQMELRPGKPTLYWLKGTGIGVYHSADTEKGLEDGVGEGTKNEGVQKMQQRGVQKMRGKGVQKMYPELINNELVNNGKGVSNSPAPAENQIPETFKAEKKETDFIAPAAAPTHAVTTHDPAAPGIVTVDPVTLPMSEAAPPRRAATLLDAEKKIVDWILGDGLETVKHRHQVAKIRFEPADAEEIAAHYASIYTSTSPSSKAAFMADPVAHFENGLFKYLKNEQLFARSTPKQNQNQPTRNQNAPARSNIQHLGGVDDAKYFQ